MTVLYSGRISVLSWGWWPTSLYGNLSGPPGVNVCGRFINSLTGMCVHCVFACASAGVTLSCYNRIVERNFCLCYARSCWLCNSGIWLMLMWGSEAAGQLASRGSCSQVPPALFGGVHASFIIHRLTVEMELDERLIYYCFLLHFPSVFGGS